MWVREEAGLGEMSLKCQRQRCFQCLVGADDRPEFHPWSEASWGHRERMSEEDNRTAEGLGRLPLGVGCSNALKAKGKKGCPLWRPVLAI